MHRRWRCASPATGTASPTARPAPKRGRGGPASSKATRDRCGGERIGFESAGRGAYAIVMTPSMEFWFEFASTYSYLAASRVEKLANAAGVTIVWRPFLLGPVFKAQGWNDSPFNVYPVKGRYMWRDLERICTKLGLGLQRPSQFPRNGLTGARVAQIARGEGRVADFTRTV